MKFQDYLSNVEKVFKFRIKTLFPLEDGLMDLLEKALQKYRPISVSKPKKTMFQTSPLGFTGDVYAEVYMCDVELTVPVTATLLQFDLLQILGLNPTDPSVKVFSEHQDELEQSVEPLTPEKDEEKVSLLANEKYEEVPEVKFSDYYGDDYNTKYKAYLKDVEAERAEKKGRGKKVDAKHPLTKWANQPKSEPKASDTEQPK